MSDIKLETIEQRASYGIGRQMGDQLAQNGFDGVDINAVAFGLKASFTGEAMHVEPEDLQAAFNELTERLRAQQEAEAKEKAAAGQQFLDDNAKRDEVTVTESGLQYEILSAGDADAEKPTTSNKVRVHYHGTFTDGSVFDSQLIDAPEPPLRRWAPTTGSRPTAAADLPRSTARPIARPSSDRPTSIPPQAGSQRRDKKRLRNLPAGKSGCAACRQN